MGCAVDAGGEERRQGPIPFLPQMDAVPLKIAIRWPRQLSKAAAASQRIAFSCLAIGHLRSVVRINISTVGGLFPTSRIGAQQPE